MSGPAEASRDALVTVMAAAFDSVLEDPGSGVWSAPCVILEPGNPWLEPGQIGGAALVRYRVHCIVDRGDWSGLTVAIDTARATILAAPGWTVPTVSAPVILERKGASYLSAELAAHVRMNGG